MNPGEKGWVDAYLNAISKRLAGPELPEILVEAIKNDNLDQSLYKILQPTGLLYGHPVQPFSGFFPDIINWDDKEKMKVILLDSFLHNSFLINKEQLEKPEDFTDLILYSTNQLNEYYRNVFPYIDVSAKTFLGRQKSIQEVTEEILEKRISVRRDISKSFWSSFFQNSLLFLDVFYFGQWLQSDDGIIDFQSIINDQEEMRLMILKVITAAAYANDNIEKEEKVLFEFFLQSAHLPSEKERIARDYLNKGIDFDTIELPEKTSWLLRKYILELAILTIWSDKIVEESEKEFIKRLADKLFFDQNELDSSMLAIESFVISNWEHVHYLQSKHNFHIIRARFTKRMGRILKKNQKAITQEIRESKELMELLYKSTKEHLTSTEKEKVKEQLIDILKTLPTFVIIALPGSFITIPLLLKLLPKSAFPSAFKSENIQ